MSTDHVPELLNLENPGAIMDIHRQYVESGADIIYANTFGANRYKLSGCGKTVAEVVSAGVANAKKAAAGKALTALDIGPIGQLLEPAGTLRFEEAYDCYKEIVIAGADADVIVIETMTDLYEVKAAVLAAKENSDKPVLVTMTFEENMRTFTGVSAECMVAVLEGLGVDAIGVNCSLGPEELFPVLDKICSLTVLPVIAKPNAGLPDPVTNKFNVGPDEFAASAVRLANAGVKIFGGCCGTTPAHIAAVIEALRRGVYTTRSKTRKCSLFSSVLRRDKSAACYRRTYQPDRKKALQGGSSRPRYRLYPRTGCRADTRRS